MKGVSVKPLVMPKKPYILKFLGFSSGTPNFSLISSFYYETFKKTSKHWEIIQIPGVILRERIKTKRLSESPV